MSSDLKEVVPSLNGHLLINKPSGPTTYDLIRWFKRSIKGVKIGHAGTLDPFATGLVILLLGKETKKQSFYMGQNKTYLCRMKVGVKTDTGDLSGQILKRETPTMDQKKFIEAAGALLGPQKQIPPMFSALKVKGQRLYDLARKGQTVERKERDIHVYSLKIVGFNQDEVDYETTVSSGTYIRTLTEDLAEKTGQLATTVQLIRRSIGSYSLDQAIPGEELKTIDIEKIQTIIMRNG